MTVGTAARRAGVKIDTIRYYERRALLPKSPRTEAGYRTLTDETVQRHRPLRTRVPRANSILPIGASGSPNNLSNDWPKTLLLNINEEFLSILRLRSL